jgi:hypothetical protein
MFSLPTSYGLTLIAAATTTTAAPPGAAATIQKPPVVFFLVLSFQSLLVFKVKKNCSPPKCIS